MNITSNALKVHSCYEADTKHVYTAHYWQVVLFLRSYYCVINLGFIYLHYSLYTIGIHVIEFPKVCWFKLIELISKLNPCDGMGY